MEIRYRSTMIDADKEFEKLKANKDKILAKLSEMGMADESRFWAKPFIYISIAL